MTGLKVLAWPAFKTRYKNPYNWLLYSPMLKQGVQVEEFSSVQLLRDRYDIFHVHWATETIVRHPNPIVAWGRAKLMLALIDWAKLRGTRLIWTVHDATPHIVLHPSLADWFQQELASRVDGYINICEPGQAITQTQFPLLKQRPNIIIPHGHYRGEYPNQISRKQARQQLGIPESVPMMLFLGYIAAYKNVPHLIQVFRQGTDPHLNLVIAGKPELPKLRAEVQAAAQNDPRIKLILNYIPNEQLQWYFKAADLVVLPFQEILNSGSALLALSFNCPVLVPQQGAMGELQAQVGVDWVKTYTGCLRAEILQESLTWALNTPRPSQAPLEALDWSILSQKTIAFYQEVCQSHRL